MSDFWIRFCIGFTCSSVATLWWLAEMRRRDKKHEMEKARLDVALENQRGVVRAALDWYDDKPKSKEQLRAAVASLRLSEQCEREKFQSRSSR